MTIINLDIETRSACDLQLAGGYRYAEDPTTEILCYAYKIDDGEVRSVIGAEINRDLYAAIADGATIRGWNVSGFDVPVWNALMPVHIYPNQVDDTMDRARVAGLPAKLDNAARFLGLQLRKDLDGHALMMRVSKAVNPPPTTDEILQLAAYCRRDVEVETMLASLIPPLPEFEVQVMRLSHRINDRGFMVDTELASRAVAFASEEMRSLSARITELTDGAVTRHTQRDKIFHWLKDNGCKLPNLQKQTLEDALNDDYSGRVHEVIDIRLSGAKASTAKFKAALNMAMSDTRIRGTFVYYGAPATGRWSGKGIQPHNLPRETADDPYAVLTQIADRQVPSVYKALSTLLRPLIVAPEGKSLVRCDFSAIEGRVVAWLADDKVALTEYAGAGKMYERAAAGIYGVHILKVTKPQRQIGKVAELALGFQGGYKAFESMAKNYGVKVPPAEAKEIVKKWRASRPAVVNLWAEVERCAVKAFRNKERAILCCKGKVMMVRDDKDNLWIRLPAGRFICLPGFNVTTVDGPYGVTERLTYKRGNWVPAKGETDWPRADTYGGSLVESLAQGIARDLLAESMLVIDNAKLDIVMHVHDEMVVECDDADAPAVLAELEREMSIAPPWAKGLPLAAVGEISKRFGK